MNTTPSMPKIVTSAIVAVIAAVATPAVLFLGAGAAQADTPHCNLSQVPATCTDQIAAPQAPSAQATPRLSHEWFRPGPIVRRP
jgi:hypothetical protein